MLITALDIGTSEIKAIVAQIERDRSLSLLGIVKKESAGLRKGEVISADELSVPLSQVFTEIKQIKRAALKNIFVGIGGVSAKLHRSRGIVAVSRADNEIYDDDVERAVKASEAINIGLNRMMLHTITTQFVVDGTLGIINPLGMMGQRLEVESLIIDTFKSAVNNLVNCIEGLGGRVGGLIYGPLAASRATASKNQKDLGVVMIDIGTATTGMAVYEEQQLLDAQVLPVGSGHITNDLAIGLRCSLDSAEKIKLAFGHAFSKDVQGREKIELREIDETLKSPVTKRFISEIIEVRLEEIFELVNNALKLIGRMGKLPAGAVLTGGGAKMPGIVDLAKKELKLPARLGIPEIKDLRSTSSVFKETVEDLEFADAVGILAWGREKTAKSNLWPSASKGFLFKVLRYFIP